MKCLRDSIDHITLHRDEDTSGSFASELCSTIMLHSNGIQSRAESIVLRVPLPDANGDREAQAQNDPESVGSNHRRFTEPLPRVELTEETHIQITIPTTGEGSGDPANGDTVANTDVERTRVKLTGYRLLNIGVVFTFGTVKVVLSCLGESVTPNALDWFLGVFFTLV